MLNSVRIGSQNQRAIRHVILHPQTEKECTGTGSRDQEAAAEPVVLWRCLAASSETTLWSHANHWDQGSSTKLSEQCKSPRNLSIPCRSLALRGFLHLVSVGMAAVYPQAARAQVRGLSSLESVTLTVAWVWLIISTPSRFIFQITRFLRALKRLSEQSLPLPGKAQGWEEASFADTAGKQLLGVTSLGPSQLTPEITTCLAQALHSARSFPPSSLTL